MGSIPPSQQEGTVSPPLHHYSNMTNAPFQPFYGLQLRRRRINIVSPWF